MSLAKSPYYSSNVTGCWRVAPRVHTVAGQCEEETGNK